MKIKIKLKLNAETDVDLTDCGYDANQRWDDLTEEEQNEILDPIRQEQYPNISVEEIDED